MLPKRESPSYVFTCSFHGLTKLTQIILHLTLHALQGYNAVNNFDDLPTPFSQVFVLCVNMIVMAMDIGFLAIIVQYYVPRGFIFIFETSIFLTILLVYVGTYAGFLLQEEIFTMNIRMKCEYVFIFLIVLSQLSIIMLLISDKIRQRRSRNVNVTPTWISVAAHGQTKVKYDYEYEMSSLNASQNKTLNEGATINTVAPERIVKGTESSKEKKSKIELNRCVVTFTNKVYRSTVQDSLKEISENGHENKSIQISDQKNKNIGKELSAEEIPPDNFTSCCTEESSRHGHLNSPIESQYMPKNTDENNLRKQYTGEEIVRKVQFEEFDQIIDRNSVEGNSLLEPLEVSFQEETLKKLKESLRPLETNYNKFLKFWSWKK